MTDRRALRIVVLSVVLITSGITGYVIAHARQVSAPTSVASPSSDLANGTHITSGTVGAPSASSATSIITTAGSAKRTPDVDARAALRLGLASDDEAIRIAAVERAVTTTAIDTLQDLERFDLARDPETAPTVIHGVALLGASADGATRDEAATTLAKWLREESRRSGPDVAGNVSNIVEALGDVGGGPAIDALDAILDRGDAALHVQTLAAQKLGVLADPRSRTSLERFARRVQALPVADGLDEELRVEAIEAAREALAKL